MTSTTTTSGRVERRERWTATERAHALARALRTARAGEVIDPTDHRYDESRRVWNGLIDRYPAAIARCRDTGDVAAALAVARAHRPPVSIRGGGHQVAGSAVCDDGLVIDLAAMTEVRVDPERRTARVVVAGLHAGPAEEGMEVLAPLARLGTPVLDATAVTDYVSSQSELDPLFPAGGRYLFKSHFLGALGDDAAAAVIAARRGGRARRFGRDRLRAPGGPVQRDPARVRPRRAPHRGSRSNVTAGHTRAGRDEPCSRTYRVSTLDR